MSIRPRISFFTFGCRLNQAETATLRSSFSNNGYPVVDFGEPSDIVVINTCTVTENGDADTRKLVNRVVRKNPSAEIAVVGCQAQMQTQVVSEFPNVRWVVGNSNKMDLVSIIEDDADSAGPRVVRDPLPTAPFTIPVVAANQTLTRANLKIQDGCDFFCFFCVIPYARGRARSREFEDIMREATLLVCDGFKELVLTGVNIGTYAHDGKGFLDVVHELLANPELARLRISSIEPTTIPHELLSLMHAEPRLCRHLHLPLQSGSDDVLYRMNRRYSTSEYADFVNDAVGLIDDVCVGTDVIVGYPGETEALFDETVDFCRELPFAYLHVFSYSDRDAAKSRKFENPVPKGEINRRSRVLRELSQRKRRLFMEPFIGRTETVLFEQEKNGYWTGLTEHFIRVRARSEHDLRNHFVDVRLESVDDREMTGVIV